MIGATMGHAFIVRVVGSCTTSTRASIVCKIRRSSSGRESEFASAMQSEFKSSLGLGTTLELWFGPELALECWVRVRCQDSVGGGGGGGRGAYNTYSEDYGTRYA